MNAGFNPNHPILESIQPRIKSIDAGFQARDIIFGRHVLLDLVETRHHLASQGCQIMLSGGCVTVERFLFGYRIHGATSGERKQRRTPLFDDAFRSILSDENLRTMKTSRGKIGDA